MSQYRSEPPTPRRLREARRRGEVPFSRDLTGALALAAGLAALAAAGPAAVRQLAGFLRCALTSAPGAEVPPLAALRQALQAVAAASLPTCAAILLAAAAAGALQTGGLASLAILAPRPSRLDPVRGLRRLLSAAQLAQVALRLAALGLGLLAAVRWLAAAGRDIAALPRLDPAGALSAIRPALWALLAELAALLALLGLVDLGLQRRRHHRSLMMTPEEVRRDAREEEGDPHLKAERQRLQRAAAWAGPVARAACVVVNPTHLAVALGHDRSSGDAPRVLAKGSGAEAARIRAAARRAAVPLVRHVPLARALHLLAEVGEEIPEELFEAAASVLAHVYGMAAGEVRP